VRADLVARRDDPANQGGVPLRYPAQSEKSPKRSVPVQQLEQPVGVALHPAGLGFPIGAVEHPVESADLKMFFDVDREEMNDAPYGFGNSKRRIGSTRAANEASE
jgi:hypothetical protein